ncbi:hypothetical protein HDU76_012622, partial [Blyttiomyces sp. JEL0837]
MANLNSLTYLDVGVNSFDGSTFPKWIAGMTQLTFLSVFGVGYTGELPDLSGLTLLEK